MADNNPAIPWSWVGQPAELRRGTGKVGNYRRPLAIRDAVIAGAFGREVRRLRLARNLMSRELADLVGLSQPNISQIENERRQHVTLRHLWDFAEALGVTPQHFLAVCQAAETRFSARLAREEIRRKGTSRQ